jgi:hypothetical protein
MSKHTPGPLDGVLRDVVLTDVERCLIAAAPDMLEALKLADEWLAQIAPKCCEAFIADQKKISAALAKAEGRS